MKKISSVFKKIGFFLFNFLGLSSLLSCFSKDITGEFTGGGSAVCMYGVPGNYFVIEGIVTGDSDNDGTEEPIPEITVEIEEDTDSENPLTENTVTDMDGKYSVQLHDFSSSKFKYKIKFTDSDGENNGRFTEKSATLDFTKQAETTPTVGFGNKNFNENLNVKLERK